MIKNFKKYIISKGKLPKPKIPVSIAEVVLKRGEEIVPRDFPAFNIVEEEDTDLKENLEVQIDFDNEEIGGFIEEKMDKYDETVNVLDIEENNYEDKEKVERFVVDKEDEYEEI